MTTSAPELAMDALGASGLDDSTIAGWRAVMQPATADYEGDCRRYSAFWIRSNDVLARLPPKPRRNPTEAAAAATILAAARDHRERFLGAHAEPLYDRLTHSRTQFVRIENLVIEAAAAVLGLTPTAEQVAEEGDKPQRDKEG